MPPVPAQFELDKRHCGLFNQQVYITLVDIFSPVCYMFRHRHPCCPTSNNDKAEHTQNRQRTEHPVCFRVYTMRTAGYSVVQGSPARLLDALPLHQTLTGCCLPTRVEMEFSCHRPQLVSVIIWIAILVWDLATCLFWGVSVVVVFSTLMPSAFLCVYPTSYSTAIWHTAAQVRTKTMLHGSVSASPAQTSCRRMCCNQAPCLLNACKLQYLFYISKIIICLVGQHAGSSVFETL